MCEKLFEMIIKVEDTLDLTHKNLNAIDLKGLGEDITNNKNIAHLNLSNNGLDDTHTVFIRELKTTKLFSP